MANYNRTRLRPIDNTIANLYLDPQGNLNNTGAYARSFSFRGRNCLSPVGDLENNNMIYVDTLTPATAFRGGGTVHSCIPLGRDFYSSDNETLLAPSEISFFINVSGKYGTNKTAIDEFGGPVTFTSPSHASGGPLNVTTSVVVCTPFGYHTYTPFTYTKNAP